MFRRLPRAARLAYLAPVLACAFALGCGDGKTVRVSGEVKFKGQPVPAGKIYFIPDTSAGHTGPTGYADIKDGKYDTDAPGGRRAHSGPVIVAIEGIDPNAPPEKPKEGEKGEKGEKSEVSAESTGKLLFPRYETKFDVPTSAATKDFEVPADAAKGPVQAGKKPGEIVP